MVTCQTTRWVSTSPYVKLTVTQIAETSTSVELSYKLQYISDTPADTSNKKSYVVVINGIEVASGSYDINNKLGTYDICSGTTVISKTKATQTIICGCAFQFDLYWSNVYGGSKTAQTTISVPAKSKYSITYNANGGTGAPAAQTKWYGEAISLSSTKPTRTGYTFQGWGTTSEDTTVDYHSGTPYTKNSAITLYAIWEANTYTITYNANGGTGAPEAQTKTHGVNLTLTTSILNLKRTNYTFKGWSRTSNGAVAYQPGATYTSNAAITLYAVWELSYLLPEIYNVKAEWVKSPNILINPAETFVSGTDSNYGYQNLLSSACSRLGLFGGKVYTLTFDWAVNWGGKTPVTNVEVRVGYGEEYGDFDGVSASMVIPNLSTQSSGTISFTFTHYTGPYGGARAVPAMIQAIYCSSKDALDGTTWTISNVKLVEEGKISVEFDWETSNPNPTGNLGFYYADGSEAHTVSLGQLSGNSGHFERTIDSSNSINIDTSYIVKITLSDGGGNTTSTVTLTGNAYSIDLLAGGKGISFGGAASLENTAHFQWDARFDKAVCGNVPGMNKLPEIPANDDFNNYMTTGCWAVYKNANAETIAHIPVAIAGRLEVWSSTGEGIRAEQWSYLRQRYIPYDNSNATWERDIKRVEDNAWTYYDWHRTTLTPEASKKIYATKQYLTATITTDVAMTAVNTYTIIPLKKYKLYSGGLSLTTDGAVKIGAGISMVKVSGQVLVKCGATAGNRHVKIQIVSVTGTVTDVAWCCVTGSAGDNLVFPFTPTILTVREGETLRFAYYTPDASDAAQKGGNGYQTYIMVEEF